MDSDRLIFDLKVLELGPKEMAQTRFLHRTRCSPCSNSFKYLELAKECQKNTAIFSGILPNYLEGEGEVWHLRRAVILRIVSWIKLITTMDAPERRVKVLITRESVFLSLAQNSFGRLKITWVRVLNRKSLGFDKNERHHSNLLVEKVHFHLD